MNRLLLVTYIILVSIGIPMYADTIDTVYKQISTDQPTVKSILETIISKKGLLNRFFTK